MKIMFQNCNFVMCYQQDGNSMQNQGGGSAAPPGGLLAQALTERKPSSGNYAVNNFSPMGFQQETQGRGKLDPVVERTLSALKKYRMQPEELKRVFNENPDMRAAFNQIKHAQMGASHGQYNPLTPVGNNLQRAANQRTMLPVHQQQQQQQFVGNGVLMTENQWTPSKVSSPIHRGQTHPGGQFGMDPQQQMYINQQQPHQQDMWLGGDQMYSGVPPNRGIVPQSPQPQQQPQHHHQMGHPGPPPYPYGRTNVDGAGRMGYPGGIGGAQHQGDFPGSAAFTRYQPHPGNGAMNSGQRHLPPPPQSLMPPMGSPNGIRMGYDDGGPMHVMGGGVRQNMMSGVVGAGAAALRHENMAAAAAARGRLAAAGGSGMVRPPLPPNQSGSPKGMVRRQQQQDISPPQYQLQHQQQHEIVNGGLMNGGNYQVVGGGGGGGSVYNLYQNQSTHPQPYNDPHQQQLNERALGIDKFMMQQQQQHIQSNGNEPGNGCNDSFIKSMTSSSNSSSSNQWKMNAEEHRKIMLSNLHMALREQKDPNLLSMVDSVEAEAFIQCDTQSQYDYRLARWLASVLDKAKTMNLETTTAQPTTGGLQQQQQTQVTGPSMPSLSERQPPTESSVNTPVTLGGGDGMEEGGSGSTESGNSAGGQDEGNFSESSLSVKNPILANLLPSKSVSDAGDNAVSDNNEVPSHLIEDGKASVYSNVPSLPSSAGAAGPITSLTPPSSSESLPSSSPPQTTMASPKTQSAPSEPEPKYAASSKKPHGESSFSTSSSSSLSTPSSNANTASSLSPAPTPTTVSSSSATSLSSVASTFQSPSASDSSTFSVPATAERQVSSAAGAASGGGGGGGTNGSGGRRTSSGQGGGPVAAAAANGLMNKSGNTNPHSVDSGIGSPPRSITSTSLYSPKIQQGTSPSLAAISSDAGASPEK